MDRFYAGRNGGMRDRLQRGQHLPYYDLDRYNREPKMMGGDAEEAMVGMGEGRGRPGGKFGDDDEAEIYRLALGQIAY